MKYITSKSIKTLENNITGYKQQNNREMYMTHTSKFIRLSVKTIILVLGMTLVACGGGGGGGTTYPSVQYTGATNQATIDSSNVSDFPITMLEGSTRSDSVNTLSVISTNETVTNKSQRSTLVMSGTNLIKDVIVSTLSSKSTGASVAGVTESLPGNCPSPGSATLTVDYTNTTFNGSITFNNFCIGTQTDSASVHGKISYSGTFHLNATSKPLFDTLIMEMVYMKVSTKTAGVIHSEEFSGKFTASQFDGSIDNNVTNMTFSSTFVADGQTFKVENLSFDTSGITTLDISGRFYHPTHGYIDVITTKVFTRVIGNPTKYCDGSLQISGNGGVVDFIANTDCSQYSVTFTATGNNTGTPDYDSGLVAWP